MKKFQILTHGNKNIAKAIQDKLFELGYHWDERHNRQYENTFSFAYQIGVFYEKRITWCERTDDKWGPVITIDDLFAMQPEKKETIKIGDATYDKAEFEAATKNLTPIK